MNKVVSEDALRLALQRIDDALNHSLYSTGTDALGA